MDETYRDCPDCGTETLWSAPPCDDGHEECPDLMCLDCGAAVTGAVSSSWTVELALPAARSQAVPAQATAARAALSRAA